MDSKLVKDSVIYTGSKYIALIINTIKGFIIAKLLGPFDFAVWSTVLLILQFGNYLHFGVIYAFNKELAINKDANDSKVTTNVTFTFMLLLTVLIIAGFSLLQTFSVEIKGYKEIINHYILIGTTIVLQLWRIFFDNYYRAKERFTELSISDVVFSISNLVLILILTGRFKVTGLLFALILSYILATILLYMRNAKNFNIQVDYITMNRLLRIGFSLLIYNIGYFIFTIADRVMIIRYLPRIDLGFYTLATSVTAAAFVLVNSVCSVLFPKLLRLFSLIGEKEEKLNHIKRYSALIEILSVSVILCGYYLSKPFINILLPDYNNSIAVIRIIILGQFFMTVSFVISSLLISVSKQIIMVYIQIASLVLAVLLNYIAIAHGYGINGISVATLICLFFYGTTLIIVGLLIQDIPISLILRFIFDSYHKYLILVFTVLLLESVSKYAFVNMVISLILFVFIYRGDIIRFINEYIKKI